MVNAVFDVKTYPSSVKIQNLSNEVISINKNENIAVVKEFWGTHVYDLDCENKVCINIEEILINNNS